MHVRTIHHLTAGSAATVAVLLVLLAMVLLTLAAPAVPRQGVLAPGQSLLLVDVHTGTTEGA